MNQVIEEHEDVQHDLRVVHCAHQRDDGLKTRLLLREQHQLVERVQYLLLAFARAADDAQEGQQVHDDAGLLQKHAQQQRVHEVVHGQQPLQQVVRLE